MVPPASKKRKLQHSSDDGNEDVSSFASFGSPPDEEDDTVEDGDLAGLEEDGERPNGQAGDVDDERSGDGEAEDAEVGTSHASQSVPQTSIAKHQPIRKRLGGEEAFVSGNFKSNMFKMQVEDLLEQIRPRRGKREIAAEEALHRLKGIIEGIPARPALPIEDAEKQLLNKDTVAIPFPNPRPAPGAKYKLQYQRPANINVAGSHALKTTSRSKDVLAIDMVLAIPTTLIQEKDYLNYRYFYKRAYYLACVAADLKSTCAGQYEVRFADFHGNPLHPVIAVEPFDKDAKTRWKINIFASVAADVFSADKVQLEKNSVRGLTISAGNASANSDATATPFYNSSVRSDMLVTPLLKLLHSASKSCDAFQDACLLGTTWLRQRGLSSGVHAGGFGNFEWSALIALLLSGGGPRGSAILSTGYSSYQLFKATLQVLALKDLSKQPLVIGESSYTPKPQARGAPVIWDAERSHNLLYRMAPWAYKSLRREARTTLSMLSDQQFDGFDATFILRSDAVLYRYDCTVELPLEHETDTESYDPFKKHGRLFEALRRGLGDRVSQINIMPSACLPWNIDARHNSKHHTTCRVGLIVNPETVGRTVDHGPSAEEKAEAARFRKFWGEMAELRRFKDGSILESLVWSAKEGGESVLEQIVRFVVARHVGEGAEVGLAFRGDEGIRKLLGHGASAIAAFQTLAEAYKQMENDVRGLEGVPLSIRQIMPADAQLRSASTNLPLTGAQRMPADVMIQFEGSSRWPDDLIAIQRTKIAFLLKLAELLEENVRAVSTVRIGLENPDYDSLNQAFLDIIYDSGAAFRMRIYHDREQTLLERQLKDKTLDPRSKEIAALALAKHKRDYIRTPAHTQAIARLCSRHPALSDTIRLTKKWFASHLLANHIAPELIELLAAKTFVTAWPWTTPSSVQTGFLRTLFFLSRWDWRAEPLIVDLSGSGELKVEDIQVITTKFEAWRKIDSALNRVVLFAASNVDREGTTWTDGCPAKVVAGRMTGLAKAAAAEVASAELGLEMEGLFASPLEDFDFVLQLDPEVVGKKKRKSSKANGGGFKNLSLELAGAGDDALMGFDPAADFLRDLESAFGAAVVFFSAGTEKAIIAGLWNPQTKEQPWKMNLAYSTVPVLGKGEGEVTAKVNKEGILAEIAALGGDLIRKIDVNRT